MFCSRCGHPVPESAAFCTACGAPVAAGGVITLAAPPPLAAVPAAAPRYAGFWRRLWARFLDGVLMSVVGVVLVLGTGVLPRMVAAADDTEAALELMSRMLALSFLQLVVEWLYVALMLSASRQATLGMMMLEIKATDLQGRRLGFARATGRYFATLVTGLTLGIGYLLILFTERKQALHDLIAGTLVVREGA